MLPKQEDIIEPLLRYIRDQGGWIRLSREKYDLLEQLGAHFRLAEEEMEETISSGDQTRWYNHVCWARKKAVESKLLDGSVRGIWRITDLGRDFIVVEIDGRGCSACIHPLTDSSWMLFRRATWVAFERAGRYLHQLAWSKFTAERE